MFNKEDIKKFIKTDMNNSRMATIACLSGYEKNIFCIRLQVEKGLTKELADFYINTTTNEALKRGLVE